jgi:uncharacterized membrane protein YidH (DUF202 family)
MRLILASIVSIPLAALGVSMIALSPELKDLGVILVVLAMLVFYIATPLAGRIRHAQALRAEQHGVHWFWWLVAILLVPAIVGIPLLIVIAIIHTGRKNRALARELANKQGAN